MSTDKRAKVTGFSASGFLDGRAYRLHLNGPAAIIVGPNGTGKSTFLSLFYLMLSRQWARLNEFDFEQLTIYHTNGQIQLNKTELLTFDPTASRRMSSDRYVSRLSESNAIDLIYKDTLTRDERSKLATIVGIPVKEALPFQRYLQSSIGLGKRLIEIDNDINALSVGRILYLPTYRRIEKDITSIFPDIESRLRAKIEESQIGAREGAGFREIASFGMSDVKALIDKYSAHVGDYQRQESERAAQEYIRDIVQGKIKSYSLSNLRRMDDDDFENFKERLDEKLFSAADREGFRAKIDNLRQKKQGQPDSESRYLGMFVEKLVAAHQRVRERERALRTFVNTVSRYLAPDKRAVLRGYNVAIVSRDGPEIEIPIDNLSSGEKQIVSIFAYLFLSQETEYFILIDEPELSLSVPWQKRFLVDIVDAGSCAQLVTVTHSPFVFDNVLQSYVVDVRRLLLSDA